MINIISTFVWRCIQNLCGISNSKTMSEKVFWKVLSALLYTNKKKPWEKSSSLFSFVISLRVLKLFYRFLSPNIIHPTKLLCFIGTFFSTPQPWGVFLISMISTRVRISLNLFFCLDKRSVYICSFLKEKKYIKEKC